MNVDVLTAMNADIFESTGKKMLWSVIEKWPDDTRLIVDAEGAIPRDEILSRNLHFLTRHGERDAWMQQYRDHPGQDALRKCAWRFAFCSFAVTGWGLKSDADIMVWLDADTYTHRELPASVMEEWLDGKAIAYLGRIPGYSETGFVIYDLRNPKVRAMLGEWRQIYKTGDIFDLPEWHDSYVFDHVRRKHFTQDEVSNLTPWGRNFDHVFLNGPTGAYMDHMKGGRKDGRSSPKDLMPQASGHARAWVNG